MSIIHINKPTRMLYSHPGKKKIHGGYFNTIIVNEEDVEKYIDKEWFKTTVEALENSKSANHKMKIDNIIMDEKEEPHLIADQEMQDVISSSENKQPQKRKAGRPKRLYNDFETKSKEFSSES